jgi:type IV pilus assembly protein PilB
VTKAKQLGEILLDEGLISSEKLDEALRERDRTDRRLGRVLIDMGFIREQDLVAALAKQIGLEFVDLSDYTVDPSASSLLPESVARKYRAIPISYSEDGRLVVAMADPANLFALDDIRTITGMELRPVVATAVDIEAAIGKHGHMEGSVEDVASEAAMQAQEDALDEERAAAVEDGPIVKMVNLLITQAIGDRASDIHIEPTERDVRIRYRVDGVLHEVMRSAKNIQAGLISRLKVMADLNIAERRIPQDGRVGLTVGGKSIDLRLAMLPTVYGEKVVIRILDKSSVLMKLEDLASCTTRSPAMRWRTQSRTAPSWSRDRPGRGSPRRCTERSTSSTSLTETSSRSRIPWSTGSRASTRSRSTRRPA